MITIELYNPNWPIYFSEEAKKIKQVLGGNCLTVHHIGSTSIIGLPAKPVIDMVPVVKDILQVDLCNDGMEQLDYVIKGENGISSNFLIVVDSTPKIALDHFTHI